MRNYITHLPNVISCLRIILVWPFLWALMSENYLAAFYIFIVAGCSDGIDGYLARKLNCTSYFGGFVDPLADKLLMMTSFILLALLGKLPLWLMFTVIARDFIIMSGVLVIYLIYGRIEFDPSFISKCNTVLQLFFIFMLLFELAYFPFSNLIVNIMQFTVLLSTLFSLVVYMWTWGRKIYLDGVCRAKCG